MKKFKRSNFPNFKLDLYKDGIWIDTMSHLQSLEFRLWLISNYSSGYYFKLNPSWKDEKIKFDVSYTDEEIDDLKLYIDEGGGVSTWFPRYTFGGCSYDVFSEVNRFTRGIYNARQNDIGNRG